MMQTDHLCCLFRRWAVTATRRPRAASTCREPAVADVVRQRHRGVEWKGPVSSQIRRHASARIQIQPCAVSYPRIGPRVTESAHSEPGRKPSRFDGDTLEVTDSRSPPFDRALSPDLPRRVQADRLFSAFQQQYTHSKFYRSLHFSSIPVSTAEAFSSSDHR